MGKFDIAVVVESRIANIRNENVILITVRIVRLLLRRTLFITSVISFISMLLALWLSHYLLKLLFPVDIECVHT